ncbi:phosphatase PAP2 family protein [Hymenobacter sp. B1770]|uniref:phosphatase PAP2 family protein n=1 Tax=Hymenobacter sp. B1770 TaxID=1718788 RepID=UPI003CE71886
MHIRSILLLLFPWSVFISQVQLAKAQVRIPLSAADSVKIIEHKQHLRSAALRVLVPSVVLGVGILAHSPVYSYTLCQAKQDMQLRTRQFFPKFDARGLDDYTRHAPLAAAYAMLATGHKGTRTAAGFTIIYLLAHELDGTVVSNMKRITASARPDNARDLTSFPSSHTSQAFLTATLLHEQYGRQYPWLSVSGYAVAAATGTMRVLGNKHWATDVLAGAAVGFLSAETVWHIYPALTKLLPQRLAQKMLLIPTYVAGGGAGLAMAIQP